jgi:hypothetical protein
MLSIMFAESPFIALSAFSPFLLPEQAATAMLIATAVVKSLNVFFMSL